jgi:hypothetical protein
MSGRAHVSPGDFDFLPEDGEQFRETADAPAEETLEWQAELDSALAQIDNRLRNPRRRATEGEPQSQSPELAPPEITREMLDEIARKVADALRRSHVIPMPGASAPDGPAPRPRMAAAVRQPAPSPESEPQLRPGKMMAIRFRWPLFRFRLFSRRKRLHPLSTLEIRSK